MDILSIFSREFNMQRFGYLVEYNLNCMDLIVAFERFQVMRLHDFEDDDGNGALWNFCFTM